MSDAVARRALIGALFVGMRTLGQYTVNHPQALEAAARLGAAITAARTPLAVQWIGEAVFVDRKLLPVGPKEHAQAMEVAAALRNLGAHEVAFNAAPEVDEAVAFLQALAVGVRAQSEALDGMNGRAISWREIPHATWGTDADEVEPDVLAVTQIALAVADLERVTTEWAWSVGLTIVRRIERALAADRVAAERCLEANALPWTVARRSVSAARLVANALSLVQLTPAARRSVVDATSLLCWSGLEERGGLEPADAVARALMHATKLKEGAGRLSPHRVRTISLLRDMASTAGGLAVAGLVKIAYRMERDRCPVGSTYNLTKMDLMADRAADPEVDGAWLRLIINTEGVVPPGAAVVLADGTLAVVMGPGDPLDPWRPTVLAGGRVLIPEQPVRVARR